MSEHVKSIGKVAIVPKGAWSGSIAYTRLDLVTKDGSSYLAIKDVPVNTAPPNNTYWLTVA